MASHGSAGTTNPRQAQCHRIQSNVIRTMILVSAFYAVAWMPHNVYFFLVSTAQVPGLSYTEGGCYTVMFIAFTYICANASQCLLFLVSTWKK